MPKLPPLPPYPSGHIVRNGRHRARNLIHNIPVELLSRIFEVGVGSKEGEENELQYWDGYRFHRLEPRDDASAPPEDRDSRPRSFRTVVCLVCRHWYQVALSTPALWTTITLSFRRDTLEQLQDMLARTHGLALDLTVRHYDQSEPFKFNPVPDNQSSKNPAKPPPLVEHPYITLFRRLAPRLNILRLRDVGLWSDPWVSSLSNLIFLDVYNPQNVVRLSWTQLVSLLRAAPALKKLRLRDAGPSSGNLDDSIEPPIPLPDLNDLVLAMEPLEFLTKLLRTLYIPALKHLSLFLPLEEYDQFIEQLADPDATLTTLPDAEGQYSLLSQLESIRIDSLCLEESSTIEMLYDELQNVKLLQIALHSWTISTDYLKLLLLLLPVRYSGQDDLVRLPRLETLIVYEAEDINLIAKVAEQRKKVGYLIESLYIRKKFWLENQVFDHMIWNLSQAVGTFHFF